MPEAVDAFAGTGSPRECDAIKQSILSTFRDDFAKYARHAERSRVGKVFEGVPRLVGNRFKYSQVDPDERSRDLQRALRLLSMARVVHLVRHSSSNVPPLGAEADDRRFKVLFLDIGLQLRACGLGPMDLEAAKDLLLVNAGRACEQFIGQHLLEARAFYEEPELFFWARERGNAAAEVDFVLPFGAEVVPIEVKAGKTGTLKSLHLFLREKKKDFGVRFHSEPPSVLACRTSLPDGVDRPFRLLSLPLYLVGQTRRLVGALGPARGRGTSKSSRAASAPRCAR